MLTELCGARVWVGIPTVSGRESVLQITASALTAAIGQPTVYRSEKPCGLENLRDNQHRMLADALGSRAALLHVEDDVIISAQRLRRALLRFLCHDFSDRVCTFYLPGARFYPRRIASMLGTRLLETSFKIVNARHYWGSQAILIPSALVQKTITIATSRQISQLDMVVRDVAPIWSFVPNPVQHRDEPPTWSHRGHRHQSVSYVQ
jgi:hypothetical protein